MAPVQLPRHVLITGGSRGIGLSIAQLFASKGYRCTLLARNEDALKAAVATLQPLTIPPKALSPSNEALPGLSNDPDNNSTSPSLHFQHTYIPASITDSQLWQSQRPSSFGSYLPRRPLARDDPSPSPSGIDVLVNCAGVTQSSLFLKISEVEIAAILRTNLEAMMVGTRFLMRKGYLRGEKEAADVRSESGGLPVVINVSSLLGLQGGFGTVAYSASKAGVLGFTRALAAEYLSHRVRVNAIVPGYIESDMTANLDKAGLERRIPLGRLGKAEEVAHATLFLAENEYAHNCVLNLDGGLSAV
jgi:NAD(P)-dependent dehydrogenase (short-subunit alcohol dehydrogenase family)